MQVNTSFYKKWPLQEQETISFDDGSCVLWSHDKKIDQSRYFANLVARGGEIYSKNYLGRPVTV